MVPSMKFSLGKTGGLIEALCPPPNRPCCLPSFSLGKTGGLIEAGKSGAKQVLVFVVFAG